MVKYLKDKITQKIRTVTIARRNKLRETICKGCNHNYYNWPREYSPRGIAVADDEGCWHLEKVNLRRKNNPCPSKTVFRRY